MGYCGPANDSRCRRQPAHVCTGARREPQPAHQSSGLGVPSYGTMPRHPGVPKQRREPPTGSHGRGLAARASGGYREGSLVPCCHRRQSSVPPSRYAVPRATSNLPYAGQGSTARRSLSIPSCVGQPAGPQIQGVARPVGRHGSWITGSIVAETCIQIQGPCRPTARPDKGKWSSRNRCRLLKNLPRRHVPGDHSCNRAYSDFPDVHRQTQVCT